METKTGFETYEFKGLPILKWEGAPPNTLYVINEYSMAKLEVPPPKRRPIRDFLKEARRRIQNAWYCLRGLGE